MVKNVLVLFSLMLLLSCQNDANQAGQETNKEEVDLTSDLHSVLRPNQLLHQDSIYLDTLVFREYVDDSDYPYAVFELKDSSIISLIFDEVIAQEFQGSKLLVEWRIAQFFEAGEGEKAFFSEEMVDYQILTKSDGFESYLRSFVPAYSTDDNRLIWDFIHPEIGIHSAFNPGAMCVESKVDSLNLEPFISWDCLISEGYPEGDFCEGYDLAEEGFYYQEINVSQLPKFADVSKDDYTPYTPELKFQSEVEKYCKVLVIAGEWNYRFLTFFKYGGQWYFWIEDLCDCGA